MKIGKEKIFFKNKYIYYYDECMAKKKKKKRNTWRQHLAENSFFLSLFRGRVVTRRRRRLSLIRRDTGVRRTGEKKNDALHTTTEVVFGGKRNWLCRWIIFIIDATAHIKRTSE